MGHRSMNIDLFDDYRYRTLSMNQYYVVYSVHLANRYMMYRQSDDTASEIVINNAKIGKFCQNFFERINFIQRNTYSGPSVLRSLLFPNKGNTLI